MKRNSTAAVERARSSRRQREQEFRSVLVVEAAEKVFSRRGFRAAGMDEIARSAELSLATLYKLFGGKEELFAAVVTHGQERFLRGAEEAVAASPAPVERLDQLVEFVFEHFERHRETFRIYLGASHGFPWHIRSDLGQQTAALYMRFLDLVVVLLREGAEAKAWVLTDDRRLAAAVVGVLNNLITLRHTGSSQAPLGEDIAFGQLTVRQIVCREAPIAVGRATRGTTAS